MLLGDLLASLVPAVPVVQEAGAVEVSGLAFDCRAVSGGELFFCVRGFRRDGHAFATEAVARGAAALVVDHRLELDVPQVIVADVRALMAPAAAAFYRHPSRELQTVGVTGTNGKTTTAYLTRELLEAAGRQTGLLGTVKSVIGGEQRPVIHTTPEAIDIQRAFREMCDGGDQACALEVSSHALALHRVDATAFDVAVFTNLTQDHLDFHGTMEEYFEAKRRLFTELEPAHAVINIDDPYGARLAAELPEPPATVSLLQGHASYSAAAVHTSLKGTNFAIREAASGARHSVSSPLTGRFNVLNLLCAFAAVRALGVEPEVAIAGIAGAGQVPGRFQQVDAGQPFAVIVDYAHTPDSLENVLSAARALSERRLHVVFGCGGDRDRGKRPLMGKIAARLADEVIVTSDNPRSEEPGAIIAEILAGIDRSAGARRRRVRDDQDRRRAIFSAIDAAGPGDVVLIAGKGHEQGQEFAGGQTVPFDDVDVAREALGGRAR